MNPPPNPHFQPQAIPQFSHDAMAKRAGSGLVKGLGIILIVLAVLCLLNGIMGLVSGLTGGGVPSGSFGGMTKDQQAEMERVTNDMIQRSLGRWTFWANAGLELLLAVLSAAAGIALLRGKMAAIKLTLARCFVAVVLYVPIYGYEGFQQMAIMDDMMRVVTSGIQQQEDARARRAANLPDNAPLPPRKPSQETERVMNTMGTVMRGAGYGSIVIGCVLVVVINGVMALLVTRPKVRDYLELAESGGDAMPHFDAAMGLPMQGPLPPGMPPPEPPGLGPGSPTVMLPPGSLPPDLPK